MDSSASHNAKGAGLDIRRLLRLEAKSTLQAKEGERSDLLRRLAKCDKTLSKLEKTIFSS